MPEEVLRETMNNALAHRDYSIDKQAIISIRPGHHVSIRNPGSFRPHLLIEYPDDPIPLRRIMPEAKARNPKLADVLRVYRKKEFDRFYRQVRYTFNKLERGDYIVRAGRGGFVLNQKYRADRLL